MEEPKPKVKSEPGGSTPSVKVDSREDVPIAQIHHDVRGLITTSLYALDTKITESPLRKANPTFQSIREFTHHLSEEEYLSSTTESGVTSVALLFDKTPKDFWDFMPLVKEPNGEWQEPEGFLTKEKESTQSLHIGHIVDDDHLDFVNRITSHFTKRSPANEKTIKTSDDELLYAFPVSGKYQPSLDFVIDGLYVGRTFDKYWDEEELHQYGASTDAIVDEWVSLDRLSQQIYYHYKDIQTLLVTSLRSRQPSKLPTSVSKKATPLTGNGGSASTRLTRSTSSIKGERKTPLDLPPATTSAEQKVEALIINYYRRITTALMMYLCDQLYATFNAINQAHHRVVLEMTRRIQSSMTAYASDSFIGTSFVAS
jgi:hypothetical protein